MQLTVPICPAYARQSVVVWLEICIGVQPLSGPQPRDSDRAKADFE
jgi:hypothetical protein